MRSILICLVSTFLLTACNSSSESTESEATPAAEEPVVETTEQEAEKVKKDWGKIGELDVGMSEEQVIETMGEPTSVETLNADDASKTEDWYYGDNQKIRMIHGLVNRVAYDIKAETEIIKQLMEAKEAGDAEKTKELIEKLTTANY